MATNKSDSTEVTGAGALRVFAPAICVPYRLLLAGGCRYSRPQRATRMLATAFRFWRDEHGQDLIEYALLAGLVCIIAAALPGGTMELLVRIYDRVHEQFARLCGT